MGVDVTQNAEGLTAAGSPDVPFRAVAACLVADGLALAVADRRDGGVALAVADGLGLAVADGVALAVTEGAGLAVAEGVALGLADGVTLAVADGVGDGETVGVADTEGDGVAVAVEPEADGLGADDALAGPTDNAIAAALPAAAAPRRARTRRRRVLAAPSFPAAGCPSASCAASDRSSRCGMPASADISVLHARANRINQYILSDLAGIGMNLNCHRRARTRLTAA
jgi:hypothetical protein